MTVNKIVLLIQVKMPDGIFSDLSQSADKMLRSHNSKLERKQSSFHTEADSSCDTSMKLLPINLTSVSLTTAERFVDNFIFETGHYQESPLARI